MNPVLIQEYGFSETVISYSNLMLSVGLFAGTLFTRYLVGFAVNFIQYLRANLLIMLVLQVLYVGLIYTNIQNDNLNQYVYLVLRSVEGFGSGSVAFIVGYLINYKLLKNDFKGTINGFISSKNYLMKFLGPVLASFTVVTLDSYMSIYMIVFIVYCLLFIYVMKNEKQLYMGYIKYLRTRFNIKRKNKRLISIKEVFNFSFIKDIYKKERKNKFFIFIEIQLQNFLRTYYDIYMILLFVFYFNISAVQATFLFSMMVIGQSMAFQISYMYDKLYKKIGVYKERYQTFASAILNTGYYIFILYLLQEDKQFVKENIYVILMISSFALGYIRNIFNDRMYRQMMEFARKELKMENFKSTSMVISELGNTIGYIIAGIVFVMYSYQGIVYYSLIVSIMLLLLAIYKSMAKITK